MNLKEMTENKLQLMSATDKSHFCHTDLFPDLDGAMIGLLKNGSFIFTSKHGVLVDTPEGNRYFKKFNDENESHVVGGYILCMANGIGCDPYELMWISGLVEV